MRNRTSNGRACASASAARGGLIILLLPAAIVLGCQLLGACGGGPDLAPTAAAMQRALPPLPDDGPAWTRRSSTTDNSVDGSGANPTSGAPYVYPHASIPQVLVMDATLPGAPDFIWAIWRVQLSPGMTVTTIRVDTQGSVGKPFYAGLANYSKGHWVFGPETMNHPTLPLPPESELHSPGNSVYVAIVVMKGVLVNIQTITVSTDGGTGTDPIFDQFEPNNPMQQAWPLGPGYYHASIHETYVPEMGGRDMMDFYTVSLTAGQYLTATLMFEPYDHFWAPGGDMLTPNYNDLDVLIYPPGSTLPYDQFIESASGMTIYYYASDQGFYQVPSSGDYIIGILADADIPHVDSNAEYYLGIYVSDSVHKVTGTITKETLEIDKPFLVYLENPDPLATDRYCFNAVAPIDTAPHGQFEIRGVPDGTYTLKVRSSGGYYPYKVHPYTWPQTLPVNVAGSDVTGLHLDIGEDPIPPPG